MTHKTYYRKKISIDGVICTKAKLILIVTITLLFTANVSFAGDVLEVILKCPDEKSKSITILPNTTYVKLNHPNCCCMWSERPLNYEYRLKEDIKKMLSGDPGAAKNIDEYFKICAQYKGFLEKDFPLSEGDSKDYELGCYTKDQIKAYYDEMVEFYNKVKSSGN